MTAIPSIRQEIVVELAPDEAFELFTAHIGDWWPLAELSVFGADAEVAFRDGQLIESIDSRTSVWGTVTEWEPGARVSFTWHPGRAVAAASLVSFSFSAREDQQTLVVLDHSPWTTRAGRGSQIRQAPAASTSRAGRRSCSCTETPGLSRRERWVVRRGAVQPAGAWASADRARELSGAELGDHVVGLLAVDRPVAELEDGHELLAAQRDDIGAGLLRLPNPCVTTS